MIDAFNQLQSVCERQGGCFVVERGPAIWSASTGTYGRVFGLLEYARESTRFNLHRSLSREASPPPQEEPR